MSIANLVRPNIVNLSPYASARDEFKGEAEIFLDANENPFNNGLNRYPDPLQKSLKKVIAAMKEVRPEQLFLGNGSDEGIDLLIRVFCEPTIDEIMILPPTYGMYQVSADITNVRVHKVDLLPDFQLNVETILSNATPQTKLLFICNPNNPTGTAIQQADIITLLDNFKGIVVVDEAYIDFSSQPSFLTLLDNYPNLVVLQTFSKAWGLAAVRLGMLFASEQIISFINKVKAPYNINILTQQLALKKLNNQQKVKRNVKTIITQRDLLEKKLAKLPQVHKIYPSDANFILAIVERPNELYHFLTEKGVIIRNRSNVKGCENGVRITVGTMRENKRLMELINEFYNT